METIMKTNLLALNFAIIATLFSYTAFAEEKAAPAPTDPEIAHIVVTANAIDIKAGNVAKTKAQKKEVKEFAQLMVTDHSAVNQQASDLAKKLGVTPMDNAVSKSLMTGADENMKKLNELKGSAFDKHYVDHEVAYHQAVLDAIDKTLIPSAKNAELKALITKVRPAIASHLEHAKHMQASLK
jgi:putative membrane protein